MGRVEFACIGREVWCLSGDLSRKWRALLLQGPPFEQGIETLASEARVAACSREACDDVPGYYRAVVTVLVRAESSAWFHSGNCGYRAQYFQSAAVGERANRCAVETLVQALDAQLRGTRSMPQPWLMESLHGGGTKIWIHQGLWFRYRRRADRQLAVSRWAAELQSQNEQRRKLALWASLVPLNEV